MIEINFANLPHQHELYRDEIESAILKVARSANYIMGAEINELEENLCRFTDAKNSISCSSGTSALVMALMALGIRGGDEVITTPFTFISTADSVALVGAKPIFVDIDEESYNIDPSKIESAITKNTKAIIPVHLYGQPSNFEEIEKIAKKHNIKTIIDGAQSFGAKYRDRFDSNMGDISCTSFFPSKPLGCYGDGGAIFTNDLGVADRLRAIRVHGQIERYCHGHIGIGGRMDTIQAAVLNVKLSHYEKDLRKRVEVAEKYSKILKNIPEIITPKIGQSKTSAFAQYSIRVKNRASIIEALKDAKIPTAVHYHTPLHLQECFRYLGHSRGDFKISETVAEEILSLPMNPYLSNEQIEYICENIIKEVRK